MGRWGMGISSSDEHLDVKDVFFEDYYKGFSIKEIENAIMNYYRKESCYKDENDGIWYDIYFALADCEWKCGVVSEWLLERVEKIVTSGVAVEYFKELCANEGDLKTWAKNLNNFLIKLKSPNLKPLVQKIKKPYVPPLKTGDVFVYNVDGLFRSGICFYRHGCDGEKNKWCFNYLIAVSKMQNERIPTIEDVKNAQVHLITWYTWWEMPTKKELQVIGNISNELKDDYKNAFGARITKKLVSIPHGTIGNFKGKIELVKHGKKIKQLF